MNRNFFKILRSVTLTVLYAGAVVSCATITYFDESPPITNADEISPDQAYFYGEFYQVSSRSEPHFILFEETETGEQLLIPFQESFGQVLVAVAPGTYSTDMEVYIRRPMALLSIGKYGVFTLMPDHFEEPFVAEPGVVYYVGSFNPQTFRFNFEGAREHFVGQFGTPEGTEFQPAYGLPTDSDIR